MYIYCSTHIPLIDHKDIIFVLSTWPYSTQTFSERSSQQL